MRSSLIILILLWCATAQADLPDEQTVIRYVEAIYKAEGGRKASVPYGVIYKGCSWDNPEYCRKICYNTVYRTLISKRHERCKSGESDIECLGRRYAPINADNDPHGLNKNWIKNVKFYFD